MKTKPPIKLVKKEERLTAHEPGESAGRTAQPNTWSTAVRSWVAEFKERDRDEARPAFDNLFKDVLSESGPAD